MIKQTMRENLFVDPNHFLGLINANTNFHVVHSDWEGCEGRLSGRST